MKQCPICKSLAFDDATTCYGCLHEFSEEDAFAPGPLPESAAQPAYDDGPPSFLIRIRPQREGSGLVSWTCTVDLVPA